MAYIGIDLLYAEDPQHVTSQMVQATQIGTGLFAFGAGAVADLVAGTGSLNVGSGDGAVVESGAAPERGVSTAQSEISPSTQLAVPESQGTIGQSMTPPTDQTWGNPTTLQDHTTRHGPDFGTTDPDEYAAKASSFLQESQQSGYPTKVDSQGVIRVYDPSTNTFGAYNADGTTATFYKPTSPTYWERNSPKYGDEPWTP